MNQKQIILNLLKENPWVCITDMIKAYIPDYRRRLCDLKEDGWVLESRACQQHQHNSKILKEWRLIGEIKRNSALSSEVAPKDVSFVLPAQKALFSLNSSYNH